MIAPITKDSHWHVAYGLTGYGPEGADDSWASVQHDQYEELLELIRGDLESSIEDIGEQMTLGHEQGDREGLYDDFGRLRKAEETLINLENLVIQRGHLDPSRDDLNLADWKTRVQDWVVNNFPLPVAHNSGLYVLLCPANRDCDHWKDRDQ